ncbi:MAG: hypothetical protein A2V88_06000 [Elusimicrobia bacterium RBG_16_66_12]|nr:MAG: hypothetical protein A2V88_06000 [Elusimicrobia bacterium RBG_16_66_12]
MAVRVSLVLTALLATAAVCPYFALSAESAAPDVPAKGDFFGAETSSDPSLPPSGRNDEPAAKPAPLGNADLAREGKIADGAESEPVPEPLLVNVKLSIRAALDRKDAPAAERLFQDALKQFPRDPDLREVQDRRTLHLHEEKVRAIFSRARADGARLFGHQWLPGQTVEDEELGVGMDRNSLDPRSRRKVDPVIKAALTEGYRSLDRGDPARAEKVLTGALRRHDDSAELHYARVLARGMGGNLKKADEDSLRAVTLSREAPVALSQRASLMMTMGRRAEAFAWANRALEGNPQDADALAIRGRVLWEDRKRSDLAIEALKKAAEIDPEGYKDLYQGRVRRFHGERALGSAGKGDYKQALTEADAALEIDPSDALARTVRGMAFFKTGKVEESIKEATLALKSDPGSKWALAYRAMAMETLGARRQALADFKRAAGIDPARFGPDYERLARAQREGSPPLWGREGKARVLADSR